MARRTLARNTEQIIQRKYLDASHILALKADTTFAVLSTTSAKLKKVVPVSTFVALTSSSIVMCCAERKEENETTL